MLTVIVAIASLALLTAAGLLHRRHPRRLTLVLLLGVAVLAMAATASTQAVKWVNCDCR